MLFNKTILNKKKEEENENEDSNDLTEQDYIQINKDISKALINMKKEEEISSEESSEESEKELDNFDIDFFSEKLSSISIDNNSHNSDYSNKSDNVETIRKDLNFDFLGKIKNTNELNDINENNNKLNSHKFSCETKNSSSTSFERFSEPGYTSLSKKILLLNSRGKERKSSRFNSFGENSNNSEPHFHKYNNSLIKSNYITNDVNIDNHRNNNFKYNVHKNLKINNFVNNINNDLIIQEKIQPILNNNMNNINFNINNNICINNPFINNMNNNYYFNNNFLNNMNIINCNNNLNLNNLNQNFNMMINKNNNEMNHIIPNLQNINNGINNNNQNQGFCSIPKGNSPTPNSSKENVDSPKNIIHIDNILKSKDKRTTLIIRNIPNRYTISLLLEEINKNYSGKYDVIYLPQDYVNNSNLGFGFINFLDHMYLVMFYEEFVGKKWNCFNSNKRCQLAYSKYQGKNELIKYIHKKLGISSHYNNNENLKKSFYINTDDKYSRPQIEIPIKYYNNFISYFPFSLYHKKDDKLFVVDKFYNF